MAMPSLQEFLGIVGIFVEKVEDSLLLVVADITTWHAGTATRKDSNRIVGVL